MYHHAVDALGGLDWVQGRTVFVSAYLESAASSGFAKVDDNQRSHDHEHQNQFPS